MKKIYFLVLLILLSIKAITQNNLPPVYEIKTDTATNITLDDVYNTYIKQNGKCALSGEKLSFSSTGYKKSEQNKLFAFILF